MHYSVVDEQRREVKCKYIVQEVNLRILRAEKAPSHANRACSFLHSGFILLSQPEGWFSDGLLSPQILLVTSLSGALWWKSVYLYINVTADLMRGRKIWKSKKNHSSKDSSFALLWDIPFENIVSLPLKCKWGLLHALSPRVCSVDFPHLQYDL